MKTQEAKIKPFRLVKYFSYSSLIVLFAGIMVLTVLNTHWVRKKQLEKSEEYAFLIAANLNHQLFTQFIIPASIKYGKIQLRNKEQSEIVDNIVSSTLHGYKVDNVTIYSVEKNIVSYSLDKKIVGKENIGGQEYFRALLGEPTTKLVQRGNYIENLLGLYSKNKMVTFAPLRIEKAYPGSTGPIIGVIEIEQDLSEDYKSIFKFQHVAIIAITVVMSSLFGILVFFVRKGEKIIKKRAMERLILEEQLRRAEHLSTLGEMIAGVSHEIRNPLGIIKSSAELLKKKIVALDPSNNVPDIIVEESVRLNKIITDFLNFAKPRKPDLVPCNIEEIIEKNINHLSQQFEEKNISVKLKEISNIPETSADSNMLYQAFLNILINSMQSMPDEGKIYVTINSDHNNINIIFEDEGIGIPEDILKKIWDPFFTTKEKGTGLGLIIAKNIIEAHNGKIEISNRSPYGVKVLVIIPVQNGK